MQSPVCQYHIPTFYLLKTYSLLPLYCPRRGCNKGYGTSGQPQKVNKR